MAAYRQRLGEVKMAFLHGCGAFLAIVVVVGKPILPIRF